MASQYSNKRLLALVLLIFPVVTLLFLSQFKLSCSKECMDVTVAVPHFQTPAVHQEVASSLFWYTLSKTADADNNIILAFVDSGFFDFALNLYIASFRPLGLKNHLFLASDSEVCSNFRKSAPGVNCIQSSVDEASHEASNFGTKGFVRKNWRKIKTVYDVLQMGFNVLLTDIDIVLFKNPFLYFKTCPTCDLQIQHDQGMICAGFYYAKATKHSVEILRRVWKNWDDYINGVTKKANDNDQVVLNKTIAEMKRTVEGFKHQVLPVAQFGNGNSYFQSQNLMFGTDGPSPPDMYMIHGNWIVSGAAKKYRFREHFMWFYDKDGYYSDAKGKYIQYENTLDEDQVGKDDIHQLEKEALEAALTLGFLLNRIVILPSFTCKGCTPSSMCFPSTYKRCALNAQFRVSAMDTNFENLYREHTFLENKMVPEILKTSVSKTMVIDTSTFQKYKAFHKIDSQRSELFIPKDARQGANVEEVNTWFSKYEGVSVLKFHSLYGSVRKLPNISKYKDFNRRLHDGVQLFVGHYMQI